MVEHRSPKPSVVSSNLTAPAKNKAAFTGGFLWHSGLLMRTHKRWFDHKRKADASMPVSFANKRCGGVANLTAPAKNKAAFTGGFLWHSGLLMRTHKRWFDHKRKADASMPVSFANKRCGGVANLTAPAIQDEGAEKRLFSLYIKHLTKSV